MALSRLIKLVRDYMVDVHGEVAAVEFKQMTDVEYYLYLRRKLGEEALEYALEPSLNELGDVLDVVDALVYHYHGGDMYALTESRRKKREELGGFFNGIGMYGATPDR